MHRVLILSWLLAAGLVLAVAPAASQACPFCSAVSMTLGEELKSSDAAVLATLVDRPPANDPAGTPMKSKFKITKILKGDKLLKGKQQIEMLFFGTQEPGTTFLIFGVDPKELAWGTPTPLSKRGIEYVEKVARLARRRSNAWLSSKSTSRMPIRCCRGTPSTNLPRRHLPTLFCSGIACTTIAWSPGSTTPMSRPAVAGCT